MKSALTTACTIKIENFEGPFDLLFHLIEKNKMNIYDIPINDITDQYMDYLFAMQELDLEIASEFLVMAATLLHIKSKLLLPDKHENEQEEIDPREELIIRLVEYKKFKDFAESLKEREETWSKVYYKLPEIIEFEEEAELLELSPFHLRNKYVELLDKNEKKKNKNIFKMGKIIQHEKVSLKAKMKEILKCLIKTSKMKFSEIFNLNKKSRLEIVTGFMAILELAKMKKIEIEQEKQFSEILLNAKDTHLEDFEEEKIG